MHYRSRRFAFLVAVLIALSVFITPQVATAQNSYTLTVIGPLPNGATEILAFGINNAGQVAGGADGPNFSQAFRWDALKGIVLLGTSQKSGGGNINEAGVVCGSNEGSAALFDPLIGVIPLQQGQVTGSHATGVNIRNQACGLAGGFGKSHALVWDVDGTVHDLGLSDAVAWGINDSGQVVGEYQSLFYWDKKPFLWDSVHGVQTLALLPGATGAGAFKIRNDGVIVGQSFVGYYSRATTWVNGIPADTNPYPGDSRWEDINGAGQMVGQTQFHVSTGFTYRDWGAISTGGQVRSLLYYLDRADTDGKWERLYPTAINDKGQIVGYMYPPGVTGFSGAFAFLLTPSDRVLPYPHEVNGALSVSRLGSRYDPALKMWYARTRVKYLGPAIDGPAYLALDNLPADAPLVPPSSTTPLLTLTQPPYESLCIRLSAPGGKLKRNASTVFEFGPYSIAELARGVNTAFTPRLLVGEGRP